MKKKMMLFVKIIIAVAVVVGVVMVVKNYVGNKVEKVNDPVYSMYSEQPVQRIDLETFTRGSGIFSSFHTSDIKVDEGYKIVNQYVNDGDAINANQNVFLVNNGYESSYIKSPIAGLFFEKQGENAPTTYQIFDTNDTGVMIQVSEENVAKLQIGQKANVLFTAIGKEVEGEVSYISKIADAGNFSVRIRLPYSEDLRFGYNGSVKIVTASKPQALCVPYNAVQFEGDKAYVIKAKHLKEINKTNVVSEDMKTYIQVGASDNDFVEVLEGLEESDQVLMGNYF